MVYLDLTLILLCCKILQQIKYSVNCYLIGLIAIDIFVAMLLSLYMLSHDFTYTQSLMALGSKEIVFLSICCYMRPKNKACLRTKQIYLLSVFINYLFLFISQLYHPALYLLIFTLIPLLQMYYIVTLTPPARQSTYA